MATANAEERPYTGFDYGDEVPDERQLELKALADRQYQWAAQPEATRGESVFKDVELTGADVSWLWEYWGADIDTSIEVNLEGANLQLAYLRTAVLPKAHLEGANLQNANLEHALLYDIHLEGAHLAAANLKGAQLHRAHLEGAELIFAELEGAALAGARLDGANLSGATFDKSTHLTDAVLTNVSVDRVTYDNVNLTVVDWGLVPILGDEMWARNDDPERQDGVARLDDFVAAVRANRVLAATLRSQGMTEDADRYVYRAQVLQREVLRRQGHWGRSAGSWLLDIVSGYGYKPARSIVTYALIISLFAGGFFLNAQFATPHLRWDEALVLSLSSFHGRGFFTSGISLSDTLARLAAGEAVIGLLIEVIFISTFTQKFFGR